MAPLQLVPENTRFFDLIEKAGANLVATAHATSDLLANYAEVDRKLKTVEDLEHAGDEITHEVMTLLNRTFITPLDREDISGLMQRLDDIVDDMWAASLRLSLYRIPASTPIARRMGEVLVHEAESIAGALPKLRRRSHMRGILPISIEIHSLENQADDLLHEALAALYDGVHDVGGLVLSLKWHEIYGFLESATDRGEDAANVLESIVLKYA